MKSITKVIQVITGIFVGLIISLLLGALILFKRPQQIITVLQSPIPTIITTAQVTITWTPTPPVIPTPTLTQTMRAEEIEEIISKAERAINEYYLDKARDLLTPLVLKQLEPELLARVYKDLGDIESNLGNLRMACGYYENQYSYERTFEVLYILAQNCYASGLLIKSAVYYQELLDWPSRKADIYRQEARLVLEQIRYALGTPEPTAINH